MVGAGLCCFLLLLSQNFLWSIEIHDYGEKDRAFLTEVMEDYGIHVGAYLPGLDCRLLQQQILMEIEDISWMALNRKGTVLEVSPSAGTSVTENTSIDLVVSSGATEKTANITFDLPKVSHDVTIYVYLDGTQYQSPVTVNPELKGYSYNLSITGKSGVKTLSIKIDTTSNYRVFSLDFDKGTWNQTGSNSYVDTQASTGND